MYMYMYMRVVNVQYVGTLRMPFIHTFSETDIFNNDTSNINESNYTALD